MKFKIAAEILDGEGTARMQAYGWPMFRDPQGVIKNVEMEIGLTNSSKNRDFLDLLAVLDGFGVKDFRTVSFVTPGGVITQQMYGASYELEAKRFDADGTTYWGTLPVKFVAEKAFS